MGEDVHRDRFYVFIQFCRVIEFLLRDGVVFCALSSQCDFRHYLYTCYQKKKKIICIHPVYFDVSSFSASLYIFIFCLYKKCII